MCNIIYNIELVSYIYNVSRLMLTINMLLLLIASVRIGPSVLLCLYWFKGFRFRRDGGLVHTYAHILVLRESHEEPPLTGLPPCFVTPRTLINIPAPALLCFPNMSCIYDYVSHSEPTPPCTTHPESGWPEALEKGTGHVTLFKNLFLMRVLFNPMFFNPFFFLPESML